MDLFQNPIFQGITPEEYSDMEDRGALHVRTYPKGTVIFRTGDITRRFGLLRRGKVHIESIDAWGSRLILHHISPGQVFAETYAFCQAPLMVDVTAVEDSQVLLVDLGALLPEANRSRGWYTKILYHLLLLTAEKNLAWSGRMFCISPKTIRGRVMTFLSAQALQQNSRNITIPFDRQQMADYLNVERSALSKELGRMKREGILSFRKNHFHLLQDPRQDHLPPLTGEGPGSG